MADDSGDVWDDERDAPVFSGLSPHSVHRVGATLAQTQARTDTTASASVAAASTLVSSTPATAGAIDGNDDDGAEERQALLREEPSPLPQQQQVLRAPRASQQSRMERNSSSGDGGSSPGGGPVASSTSSRAAAVDLDWGVEDDGWMPKPARLHAGKTRSCTACFAPLQYTTAASWDEYLQSDEYLRRLQANLLDDTFISGLICGDSTGGDLPTEHRMHKNRKMKCRQSVHDYLNMVSAGVVDKGGKEKGSVRTLEEMLLTVLPTPLFTCVLERRLAVISHSSRIASALLKQSPAPRAVRPLDASGANVELHHLAVHTLSALLASFDYASAHAQQAFEEMARLLACFPVLSLYAFWSPTKKSPERALMLRSDMVDATSCAASPRAHPAELAVDDSDATYWLSQQRPGLTHFVIRHADIGRVVSVQIRWHAKCVPQKVAIEYRVADSDAYVAVAEEKTTAVQPPEYFSVCVPTGSTELRIAMSGIPSINRNGTYAIESIRLNVPCADSLFIEPRAALNDVARWLLGALRCGNDDVVVEAIGALKAWALATASLSTTLLFVKMVLDLGAMHGASSAAALAEPGVARFALTQGQQLVDGVCAYKSDECEKVLRGEGKKRNSESRKVRAVFEPSVCSSGVTIEEAGVTVRTRETSYQYAAVNTGIVSGKASWKFRLDNDTVDDEMTCFGAAILPVTVSGYDSSPSLWMLRGYNGNLYARGHKLSRSIGKVHPGDVVTIEVDMIEGTLAYTINETEYGVVFTDLAGHEVYPAVSFYGSGKVITLLGVQKWDDTGAGGAGDIDPVYLSNLKEYHYAVGYGTFGKGNQLGYASDADARTLPTSSTARTNNAVVINGEPRQRCLSTHPPSRGTAFVIYDLGDAFDRFVGAVGINDDVAREMLQQRSVAVTFSIVADGTPLWQSKAVTETRQVEKFDISVRGVRMLELTVACAGSNHCAHAIWIDPCVYPLDEWTCSVCTFANKGASKRCNVCRSGMRDAARARTLSKTDASLPAATGGESLSAAKLCFGAGSDSHSSALAPLDPAPTVGVDPFLKLSAAIMSELFELATLSSKREKLKVRDATSERSGVVSSSAGVGFEEPFCRQPCGAVFSLLLDMLRRFQTDLVGCGATVAANDSRAQLAQRLCISTLGLVSANFESITAYDVGDLAAEIGLSKTLADELRCELEWIASISDSADASDSNAAASGDALPSAVQIAASETIIAGISVIYSSPNEKLQLLLHLLRRHAAEAFAVGSSRYVLLSALMRLLASPGQEGILNLFPFVRIAAAGTASTAGAATTGADRASSVDTASLTAVNEAIRLLIDVIQQSDWATHAPLKDSTSASATDCIASDAMALLKAYQLFLLAEAVGLTKTARADTDETALTAGELDAKRQLVQEATVQYGFQLLRACRELVETLITEQTDSAFTLSPTECALRASLRTLETPVLSELLPWFVSCLCLLRRQTWLARPVLPALCRLLGSVDQYCAALPVVDKAHSRLQKLELHESARQIEAQELERMLAVDKSLVVHAQASKTMYNVFKQLYTGDKDHFEGQIGFQFEATSTFAVVALGRSVNPSKNSGRLVRQHAVRLWEEASQLLVAQVIVSGTSRKDALGYALEPLAAPVKLTQGKLYRLTTHEYANGGDPWYKKENLPDEEYDSSYIKILRDCYASGSTAFPNSQNLSGAAYGVPTFLVEGENPITSLPRFAAPFGSLVVQFNTKRKLASVRVSHSGTAAHGIGSASWRSCVLQHAFVQGVHAVDFIVKSARAGGTVSGHVCIGVDWSLCEPLAAAATHTTSAQYESFFGESCSSVGWMPAIGALWVKGERVSYGPRLALVAGDILTLVVDFDLHSLSFAHNGTSIGVAVGLAELQPASSALPRLPAALTPGVSIYGAQDVVQIRPSGIAKSTLRVHWLFDLHNSLASLAGRIASTLIAGHPVDSIEEELLPWLQSPLLSGGILSETSASGASPLDWQSALEAEYAQHPSDAAFRGLLFLREQSSKVSNAATGFPPKRGASNANAAFAPRNDLYSIRQSKFFESLSHDMSDTGPVQIVLNWLGKRSPDRSFLSRFGRFPQCERLMCAALIKHAPPHVLHEAQAIVSGAVPASHVDAPSSSADTPLDETDAVGTLDHSDLEPSDDLLLVWKRVVTLRHWLIKTRQEYRTRTQDEATSADRSSEPDGSSDSAASSSLQPDELAFEKRLALPKTFDDFVARVCQRAEFLCLLDPPSEERDKLGVDSQVALSNLAEKWSAQKTPPALQPMLERWKSLREADSSKWSGIVDVLRAQDRWRTRRASITGAAVASLRTEQLVSADAAVDASAAAAANATDDLSALDEQDDAAATTKPKRRSNYKDTFSATIKACDLYIRNGVGAPPAVLRSLLERRQKRSDSRLFGLEAIASVLRIVSFDSARHNAIIFLRPALRGFTDDERESRELNDGHVVTETFRATVRHHYLKGLEGCNRATIERVQRSFCDLYAFLAQLLSTRCGASLQHAVLCAWSLDFEARDHPFLLKTGILSTLHELFSLESSQRDAAADLAGLRTTARAYCGRALTPATAAVVAPRALQYTTINWHPLSEDFVQQSVLHTGFVTKRDILRLLLRAPAYACSRQWWTNTGLEAAVLAPDDGSDASGSASTVAPVRHTASSMSLLYAELLQSLQHKLAWCCPHLLSRKALQLGMSHMAPHGASATKPPGVSYVETPALGEVHDFSLEMWVYPVELAGYRSLRSDNGFQDGSVCVEFVDQHLQVGIRGHYPREQLFTAHTFRAHEWTHIALTYSSKAQQLVLVVNGVAVDTRRYERVGRTIHFRAGRLGCWVSEADAHGVTAATASPQRSFKGALAEVRVWRVARSVTQIARDFQRSVPFDVVDRASSGTSSSSLLLALWHLDEGEGLGGSDSAPSLGRHESRAAMREGKTANFTACHWALMNVPVATSPRIDALDSATWSAVLRGIVALQRRMRWLVRERYHAAVLSSQLVCKYEETRSTQQRWGEQSSESDDDDDGYESDDDDSDGCGATDTGRTADTDANPLRALERDELALVKEWSVSTDQQILLRKQTRRCAWLVFRFLATIGVGGVHDRREDEAATVAALAKLKRRQKLQRGDSTPELGSPMHAQRAALGKSDASARGAGPSYDEEEQHARTLEAASDAAKSAATNRELAEPVLQTLWFSQEVQRKVFEVIEKELVLAAALIQDAEGLTRAQRMLRSISTPVQRRGASLRTHASGVDGNTRGLHISSNMASRHAMRHPHRRGRLPSELAAQGELMETLEVEMSTFALLSFMLSLSASAPALTHLAKSKTLRELLELLRTASPRAQRVVKLLLRRVCCGGIVTPTHVSTLLGSESVFVDLLLDQVAESVCSTAAPLSAHAIGASTTDSTALNAESLANPMGFRSGQISLVLASESVALLRLLLKDKRWQSRVAELLCTAIRNVAPVLARRKLDSSTVARGGSNSVGPSDIRVRAAIVRAVGALCVLGSHSDCLRIGGRVVVTAKGSRADAPNLDYGFHLSGRSGSGSGSAGPASATLIELNSRTSTVRVVFDASSEDVDPGHNAQEVALSLLAPVEEIRLPSDVIPLTLDMMPVILKLASLEESSVMASFDDLWRMQVRSRALLALEALLRHSVYMAKDVALGRVTSSLLSTALTPVRLNTFVSLPCLQERGRMILCRLIESSTPLGSAMFRGLGDPKSPVIDTASDLDAAAACPAGIANSDPEEEEAEEFRVRRGFASSIAAMGFAFDLCMAALEHCRDDPNLAVDWLMGPAAVAYQEQKRLATERLVARQTSTSATSSSGGGGDSGMTLDAKAQELMSISGMPLQLVLCALELSSSDPNSAMEWLMEHGTRYIETTDCLTLLADDFVTEKTLALDDHAAMEDVDQPDPLVTLSSTRSAAASATGGSSASAATADSTATLSQQQQPTGDNSDIMAVTLAPILAPSIETLSAAAKRKTSATAGRDARAPGFAPLDPNYLTPNVLLSVSTTVGPLPSLSASGRTGVYRRYMPDQGVLITFLNTETGAYEDEWHLPQDVRRITRIYDEPVESVSSIHRVALRTENALATHYARRAIAALLDAGSAAAPQGSSDEVSAAPAANAVSAALSSSDESTSSSFADATLRAVGGPRQFVNLLKLVAASEMVFSREPDAVHGLVEAATPSMDAIASASHQRRRCQRADDSTNSGNGGSVRVVGSCPLSDESGSILEVVRQITLDILDEEARGGKVLNADSLWHSGSGSRAVAAAPGAAAAVSSRDDSDLGDTSQPLSSETVAATISTVAANDDNDRGTRIDADESVMVNELGELDEDLYRAIALSVQDAQSLSTPPAPMRIARRSGDATERDEESKGDDDDDDDSDIVPVLPQSVMRSMRMRQPSYAEAQEVANEYLGGSVDDHDGLLSSVLVKECVSHFVESTRVAGECGASSATFATTGPPQEFQSLHPHFGRCDYTQRVAVDASFRCVRVVFDHRCRLGAKSKLSFYSDAACKHRVLLLDAAATTKRVQDLIVHAHEFWFRFVAAEDAAAPTALAYGYRFQVKPMPSICWSKEDEVLANPSLEWACWLLELLLNDAAELVARGAVHNRKIYGALVRYLRSPGAPFKSRVVRLLLQLLHRPTLFPAAEVPDLDALEAIGRLALARGKTEKDAGKPFISAHLLQLVELATMTSAAARVFAQTAAKANATVSASSSSSASDTVDDTSVRIATPLLLPEPVDQRNVADVLNDVQALTKFLLGETRALPQHVLVAIWLDAYGATGVIESAHPYAAQSEQRGTFCFPGAQSLLVTFDSRCATASDTAVLELSSRSSRNANLEPTASPARPLAFKRFSGTRHWPSGAVDFPGDELAFRFSTAGDDNVDGIYGINLSVLAVGLPREKQLARTSVTQLEQLLAKLQAAQPTDVTIDTATDDSEAAAAMTTSPNVWTSAMDLQLVDWVNTKIENAGSATLGSTDLRPSDVRLHPTDDALRCSLLLDVPREAVALRFALLKYLNICLKECVALLDLRDSASPWTLAHRLRRLSHCVFFDLKYALVEAAIDATSVLDNSASTTNNNTARITLDRLQALESRDDREVEPSVSECFFAQAFRQLESVDPTQFRRKIDSKGRLFSVKFRGEEGVDWGGVYREGANSMVDDLFSPHFSLFVLCPNGQHDTGANRGMYLPNPKCTSPIAIQMYEFVGKLLGISLRTHGDFPFMFPSLVWKQLLRAPLEPRDLEATDAMLVQMLDGIRNCARDGIVTADEFDAAFAGLDLRFTAFDCMGHEVELVDGGRARRVTFENRLEYCARTLTYRLHEGAVQVAAMVRGFATVFPLRALTLLTWQEMEILTCGTPKIDLALWQQHTRYDGYVESDDAVQLFWQAMASFSDEQRSDFVRFAWGRSRLPRGKWSQPFKLTKKGGRDATLSLPVAHTCFFSVELPPYTTFDRMRSMLLATINFGLGGILMA